MLLFEALAWLGLMRTAILLLPFRSIVTLFKLYPIQSTIRSTCSPSEQATAIGWAVTVAATHTPWESVCLGQALAGMAMLRRRKIPGILFLGVAKAVNPPQTMDAHAWLQCNKMILTGDIDLNRYSVISSFSWLKKKENSNG